MYLYFSTANKNVKSDQIFITVTLFYMEYGNWQTKHFSITLHCKIKVPFSYSPKFKSQLMDISFVDILF